jgi:ATP diphosphatase
VDPELALRASALRFRQRVEVAAALAAAEGRAFDTLDLDTQESYYLRAKEQTGRKWTT